jgi:hypothetical protein
MRRLRYGTNGLRAGRRAGTRRGGMHRITGTPSNLESATVRDDTIQQHTRQINRAARSTDNVQPPDRPSSHRRKPCWFARRANCRSAQLPSHPYHPGVPTKMIIFWVADDPQASHLQGWRCSDGRVLRLWYKGEDLPGTPPYSTAQLMHLGDVVATIPPGVAGGGRGGYALHLAGRLGPGGRRPRTLSRFTTNRRLYCLSGPRSCAGGGAGAPSFGTALASLRWLGGRSGG